MRIHADHQPYRKKLLVEADDIAREFDNGVVLVNASQRDVTFNVSGISEKLLPTAYGD